MALEMGIFNEVEFKWKNILKLLKVVEYAV